MLRIDGLCSVVIVDSEVVAATRWSPLFTAAPLGPHGEAETPTVGRRQTMAKDPKGLVRAGYDSCGLRYNMSRDAEPCPELDSLIDALPPNAKVLDIGCGGRPVSAALSHRATITGVDISPVQIAEAGKVLPDARLIAGDIIAQQFDDASFDAIVSFYTLIHLPRDEHEHLLGRIARWLRPAGYLLITVGRTDTPAFTEPDFFGVTMFWSHFEAEWYVAALERLGFQLLSRGVVGLPFEHHPVLLARAPGLNASAV